MTPSSTRPRVPVWILALSMLAAFGIALPATPAPAAAQSVFAFEGYGPTIADDFSTDQFFRAVVTVTPAEGGLYDYSVFFEATFSDSPGFVTELNVQPDGTPLAYDNPFGTVSWNGMQSGTFLFAGIGAPIPVGVNVGYDIEADPVGYGLGLTNVAPTVTPEPATVALLGGGLALLGVGRVVRRRATPTG